MNCWFCNNPITGSMCHSQTCRNHYVIYVFNNTRFEKLLKIQFKTSIYTQNSVKEYLVEYFPNQKHMEVVEQITPPPDPEDESPYIAYAFKPIFKVRFKSLILTPNNAKDKLPILLLLS